MHAWLQLGVHSVQSSGLVEHHAGQGESSTRPKNDTLKLKKESEHNVNLSRTNLSSC